MKILNQIPDSLKDGVRVISCIKRKKDGGSTKEYRRHLQDKVSRNKEEFDLIVSSMLESMDDDCRIYSSANKRNARKSANLLHKRLIDAEYAGSNQLEHFITHPLQEGISALMSPQSADEKLFLFDCDIDDIPLEEIEKDLGELLLCSIKTKNGWHIITKPFNPNGFPMAIVSKYGELKRDALILIAYNK